MYLNDNRVRSDYVQYIHATSHYSEQPERMNWAQSKNAIQLVVSVSVHHCAYDVPLEPQFGSRGFRVAVPVIWNSLSDSIRQTPSLAIFKRELKTHLYNTAFNS